MKIAIPTANGQLCAHFGHCQEFALINIDPGTRKIISKEEAIPPPHEPGVLPGWLKEAGVTTIICGGMGQRAQSFFQQYGIEVMVGVNPDSPEKIVENYMDGTLVAGENVCDH
jgi:predicted Fe-Mo cluster-binding NifX family protein